jgi:hypothetical protein
MKVRFCWKTKNQHTIERMITRFRIDVITINHESITILNDEELELLRKCETKGYIQIREII